MEHVANRGGTIPPYVEQVLKAIQALSDVHPTFAPDPDV
jgi:hypothetical protein